MSNPFSISFGLEPKEYISRHQQTDRIIDAFTEESPSNHTFILFDRFFKMGKRKRAAG